MKAEEQLTKAPVITLLSVFDMVHTTDHNMYNSVCEGCARDEVFVKDMRSDVPVPELPEAAAYCGEGYIAGPFITPEGRKKITCSGNKEQVKAFLEVWAENEGLVGLYGDPERGFAGGYLP